jgi:hypothetical protein
MLAVQDHGSSSNSRIQTAYAIRRNNIYTISKVYHILLRMKTYFQNLILPEKAENSLKMIIT